MKPERIDRNRLFGLMPGTIHDRLSSTLDSLEEEPMRKKMSVQPILILILMLCLCGAAIAAVTWDMRAYLTGQSISGNVNEERLALVQPLETSYENDSLRVDMADAIFDGSSVAATWTVTNQSGRLVYLLFEPMEDSIDWRQGSARYDGMHAFLAPGASMNGMMDCHIPDGSRYDISIPVGIRYYPMAVNRDTIFLDLPAVDPSFYEDTSSEGIEALQVEGQRIWDEVEAKAMQLFSQGSFALIQMDDGRLYVPSAAYSLDAFSSGYGEGLSEPEIYAQSGMFENLGALDIRFDLAVTPDMIHSILPDGEPVEKAYEGYVMRIIRADVSPSALNIELEAVFADEETARRLIDYDTFVNTLGFQMCDDLGETYWGGSSGGAPVWREIKQNEDGDWFVRWLLTSSSAESVPDAVTVYPTIFKEGYSGFDAVDPAEVEKGVRLEVR